MRAIRDIFHLGVKELWGLWRDPALLALIVYSFTVSIYTAATAMPESIHLAPLAVVDEDNSALSRRALDAFFPPMFLPPVAVDPEEADRLMDEGKYTFVLNIPPHFARDAASPDAAPRIQVLVDATRMSQAMTGNGYIQQIALGEIAARMRGEAPEPPPDARLVVRARFNPNLTTAWFASVMEIINSVTMLSIILTGAALIREREHGTLEHLLVTPTTPFEIMASKVWSMGLVVLVATAGSLAFIVRGALGVPTGGSAALFLAGAALHLFATTSMGIFLATVARSMPQFGMLIILVLLPMQVLSGGSTPRESMPEAVQTIMLAAPTTHFVELGQTILYRGGDWNDVWKPFLWLAAIGATLFAVSLARFRRTVTR